MRTIVKAIIASWLVGVLFAVGGVAQAATAEQDAYCRATYGNDTYYRDASRSCAVSSLRQVQGIQISVDNPLNLQVGQLVKNREFVEVFYVSEGIVLQWIKNEAAAERRFGPTWNQIIREVDSLDGYTFGATIN